MKELSTKEKAEAYDEALDRAKKWYNAPNIDKMPTYGNRIIEEIFPELKESEDWIPKEIIKYLKEKGDFRSCWIAWLKKQGQTFTKKDVDDAWLKGMCDAKHELEKQGERKPQRMISAEAKEAMYGNPAWSEEDEEIFNGIILRCKKYGNQEQIDWLKSLRPQKQWKPSDEQMADLWNMVCECRPSDQQLLQDLYYGLKTLRGE